MGENVGVDRRGFLRVLSVGSVAIAAAPQLVLPKARSLPGAEARVFVPPAGGWQQPRLGLRPEDVRRLLETPLTRELRSMLNWRVVYDGLPGDLVLEDSSDGVRWSNLATLRLRGGPEVVGGEVPWPSTRYLRTRTLSPRGPMQTAIALPRPSLWTVTANFSMVEDLSADAWPSQDFGLSDDPLVAVGAAPLLEQGCDVGIG